MEIVEVGIMALRGIATQIFDIFFLFTILTGYLIMFKFNQSNNYGRQYMKRPKDMMIEMIVQGIVIGIVFSFAVSFVGFPIEYTQYLYFLLPLSFVLGYYHVRYTNITYSALLLSLFSMTLNGQEIFGVSLPSVNLNMAGLIGIVGILLLIQGILLFVLRNSVMMPILANRDGNVILGYAIQRFWPIPVVLLVASEAVASGESVPMPDWWPIIGGGQFDQIGYIMFLLPLLLILSYGSMSFTKTPKELIKDQAITNIVTAGLLIFTGILIDNISSLDFLGILILFGAAYGPFWIEYWQEERRQAIFPISKRGARVIHVDNKGIGHNIGLRIGDIVEMVNGVEILDLKHMVAVLKEGYDEIVFSVKRLDGQELKLSFDKKDIELKGLEIAFLPDKPEKIYEYDQIKHMGMMHLLQFQKDIKKNRD